MLFAKGVVTIKGFVNNRFLHDSKGFIYPLIGFNTLWGYEEDGYFCITPSEHVQGFFVCIRYISLSTRKVDEVDTLKSVSTSPHLKIPLNPKPQIIICRVYYITYTLQIILIQT